jgi:hypothetical protein
LVLVPRAIQKRLVHLPSELAEAKRVRDELWRDHALEMVKSAMAKNWQAAMTYLERKYPNEFALRTVNRNLSSTAQPIGDKVDEDTSASTQR